MSFDKYTHLYFICRFSTYIRDDRTNEENSFALVGGYLYLFSTHCIQVKTINSGRTVTYRLINLAIDTKSQLEVFLRRIRVKSVKLLVDEASRRNNWNFMFTSRVDITVGCAIFRREINITDLTTNDVYCAKLRFVERDFQERSFVLCLILFV